MIEKHLRNAVKEMIATDSENRAMTSYMDMTQHNGWKVYQSILMAVSQAMGNDFFSKEFTNMNADEKDMTQRVYREVYEVIKMLINPMKYGGTSIKIQAHNRNMGQTKGKENG